MKTLKVIISAVAIIVFATTVSATTTETTSKNQLRTELIELLGSFEQQIEQTNLSANVSFMLNDKNEVVVLSVESKNKSIDSYVKRKLNYKKVIARGITKGEIYVLPLKIKNTH